MSNFIIIDKKQEWDQLINSFDHSDFYHTYEYHLISKNDTDSPYLIKYSEGDKIIALPLLLREIEGSQYKDVTSVYGYSGPLTKNIGADFNNDNFKLQLQKFFYGNNIISVFSRLNPFIPFQDIVLKNIGTISFKGRIVNIDLTKDLESQKKDYNKRLKTYINHSRKNCSIKRATTNDEILEFIDIYYENMRRVNAAKDYFFPKDYFFDLINCKDFETEILLSIDNISQEIIAGAMFMKKNNIVQYHLSGVRSDHLHFNCMKLLIDEMRIISTKENYQYFNLGGGVGSKDDSLLHFKSSFSKDFKEFKLWKYIVNEFVYKELTNKNQKRECVTCITFENNSNDFFPCYRFDNKIQDSK